jgi:CheY-like chemotaxis protein
MSNHTTPGALHKVVRYPLPGLVLRDMKMPQLNGLEVLRPIRPRCGLQTLPVAFLTDAFLAQSFAYGVNTPLAACWPAWKIVLICWGERNRLEWGG